MENILQCWCGSHSPTAFSPDYLICTACSTLLSKVGLTPEKTLVNNDEEDFYGKNYWLTHQNDDLGYPDIFKRSQTDLSERCIHWLRTLLNYRLPPAKTLEIGCAHGGFVNLLTQCGYVASGLEMSPWIAKFASDTFRIPMLTGPIEDQALAPHSLDMIIMMDVLEHLPHPTKTMQHCLNLLKPDGILVIQTPNYPTDKNYLDMTNMQHPFLELLKADEHLYLFNEHSIQRFFKQLTPDPIFIQFEPAMFAQYDMFCIISKQAFQLNSSEAIKNHLSSSPNTRLVQAMLDLAEQRDHYINLYQQADNDRVARLAILDSLKNTKTGLIRFAIKNFGRKLREKIHF